MFNLSHPGRYRLQRPPLALSVVQVQYPLVGRLQELAGITPVQEALRETFPYMERIQVNQFTFAFGQGGPTQSPSPEATVSWKFTDDAGWTALIEPGSASISVGPTYETVDEFADRFERLVTALAQFAAVGRADRLGLRYINLAAIAPGNQEWVQWFRRELAGWIATDVFQEGTIVEQSISQTAVRGHGVADLVDVPHDIQAMIRHGIIPAGTGIPVSSVAPLQPITVPSFILDMDMFISGPQRFDPATLRRQFDGLHDQIDRFFYWSLADAGRQHFGVEIAE